MHHQPIAVRPRTASQPEARWETDARWAAHRATITHLYLNEHNTLHEVREIMERKHGFKATTKVYKRHLRAWGCRKNIKLKDGDDAVAMQRLLTDSSSSTASGSEEHQRIFVLPNGQTVDAFRLAQYLRRSKPWLYTSRRKDAFTPPGGPSRLRSPDIFFIPEALYSNTRAYLLGRFQETIKTPQDLDVTRAVNPHSSRWLIFAKKIQDAVADRRFEDAIAFLREAPSELNLLLLHQPNSILSNLFRFLTSILTSLRLEDDGAEQFFKVMQSLLRYGATCLSSSSGLSHGYSSRHPLRLVLESLARLSDQELLVAARRAWVVCCQTSSDLMDSPLSARANIDWVTLVCEGGASVSDLPSDFDDILARTHNYYKAKKERHVAAVMAMIRAIYVQLVAEKEGGSNPSLDQSLYAAASDASQTMLEGALDPPEGLSDFFGNPMKQAPLETVLRILPVKICPLTGTIPKTPCPCDHCRSSGLSMSLIAMQRAHIGAFDAPDLFPTGGGKLELETGDGDRTTITRPSRRKKPMRLRHDHQTGLIDMLEVEPVPQASAAEASLDQT